MATERQPPPPPQQQQRHNSAVAAAATAGAAGGSVPHQKGTTESSPRSHQPKPVTHGDSGNPEISAPDVRPLEYTAESGKAEAVGNDATLDSTAPPATEMGQARRSHEDKDGVSGAGLPVRRGVSSAASVSFGASASAGAGDVIAEVAGGNGGDERDRTKVGDDVVTGVSTSSKASTGGRGDSASGGGGSNGSKERYSESEKRSGERSFSAIDDAATATLPGGGAAADSRDVCLSVPGSSSPVCLKEGTGRDHEPPDPAITGGDGAAVPALRSTGDRGDDVPAEGVAAVGSNTNREEDMDLRPPIVVGGGSSPSAGQLSSANKLPPKASAPGGTGGTEGDPPAVASSVTLNADRIEEAGGAAEQLQPFSDSLQAQALAEAARAQAALQATASAAAGIVGGAGGAVNAAAAAAAAAAGAAAAAAASVAGEAFSMTDRDSVEGGCSASDEDTIWRQLETPHMMFIQCQLAVLGGLVCMILVCWRRHGSMISVLYALPGSEDASYQDTP